MTTNSSPTNMRTEPDRTGKHNQAARNLFMDLGECVGQFNRRVRTSPVEDQVAAGPE
ncbi:hypothetical protein [Dactylosporangium sp. NPDC049140]|uniref:hypothetical protein n=1 Tax=Dactylosporangium sp. NPDC049140 TaxID=3155647 RepID=UPI00340686E7